MKFPVSLPRRSPARVLSIVVPIIVAFALFQAPELNLVRAQSTPVTAHDIRGNRGAASFTGQVVTIPGEGTAVKNIFLSIPEPGGAPDGKTVVVFMESSPSAAAERPSASDPVGGQVTMSAGVADLTLTATGSGDTVEHSGSLTYHMQVVNHGPDAADGAMLHYSFFPGSFGIGVGTIAPGGTVHINLTRNVIEPPGTVITETLSISSGATDPNPPDNSVTLATLVTESIPRISFATAEGKRLTVAGTGFATGALIEINGSAVATKRGDTVFLQSLIAKKGGKQIALGDTVVLTVLNPDGTRSAPFQFRRNTP